MGQQSQDLHSTKLPNDLQDEGSVLARAHRSFSLIEQLESMRRLQSLSDPLGRAFCSTLGDAIDALKATEQSLDDASLQSEVERLIHLYRNDLAAQAYHAIRAVRGATAQSKDDGAPPPCKCGHWWNNHGWRTVGEQQYRACTECPCLGYVEATVQAECRVTLEQINKGAADALLVEWTPTLDQHQRSFIVRDILCEMGIAFDD